MRREWETNGSLMSPKIYHISQNGTECQRLPSMAFSAMFRNRLVRRLGHGLDVNVKIGIAVFGRLNALLRFKDPGKIFAVMKAAGEGDFLDR